MAEDGHENWRRQVASGLHTDGTSEGRLHLACTLMGLAKLPLSLPSKKVGRWWPRHDEPLTIQGSKGWAGYFT
eukprot:356345-Chlamydomonas_euryale.AAC.7